jgi:hypothetical protein
MLLEREPDRAEQLESMQDRSWFEMASFASYCVQGDALHLRSWQEPPTVVDEDDPDERDKQAQALLKRMLAARISRYHPDPLAALAEAKRARRR